ncbi:hypothetical protein B0T24DRAFT_636000 [Lasiosphaeria ovina]|uniref:VWFA domain-containing protein n=1 Tax=Lasiosphaeria ovina TaxID=92902 RepID=A0AAE0JWS6_9PEZI|nr:hypothetical protein B0T24DRAFT_636000 [Lasiosphaeria ovina]
MSQDSTPLGSYQSVSSVASTKEFPASDCFHDGNEMSKTVSDWHKHLRHALRSSDPVTAKILDMVEDYMLQGDPAKRLDASQLATMIKAILTEAKSKVAEEINSGRGYKPPAYFQDAVDLEQEVEAAAVRERLTTRGDEPWRDKYKSQAFIDATKEPLGRLVEDLTYSSEYRRELVWDQSSIDDLRLRRGTTIPAGMPLHRGSSSTFRDARPQSIDDPRKTRIPSDILYANYSSARKLLDDAGWRPGALELPDYFHESHTPVSSSISLRTPVSPSPADGLFISEQPLPPLPLPKKSSGSDRSSLSLLKTTAGSWFSSKKRRSTVGTPVPRQVDVSVERPGPTVIQEPEGATADPLSPHHVISEEHRFDKFDVYFKKRDIAFLIDNGSSMDEYWLWAMDLVSVLVAFLYGQDDDGMELYFTSSRAPVGSFHEPKQFIEAMSRMKPKPRSRLGGSPSAPTPSALPPGSPFIMRTGTTSTTSSNQLDQEDIRESLAEILEQWGRKHAKKEKKKLTLIILTDGVWPGISKKETVANEIIRALEKWQDKVPLKEQLGSRGLSIQFVRFGDDPKAIEILDWMDNELSTMNGEQLPDIIDHEPATGNIYKMILGSLDSRYDEDDDNRTVRPEDGGSETYPTDADGEHGDIVSEVARSVHSRSGGSSQYIIHSGGAFDRTGPRQSQTFKV